jgi:hypothetical protein
MLEVARRIALVLAPLLCTAASDGRETLTGWGGFNFGMSKAQAEQVSQGKLEQVPSGGVTRLIESLHDAVEISGQKYSLLIFFSEDERVREMRLLADFMKPWSASTDIARCARQEEDAASWLVKEYGPPDVSHERGELKLSNVEIERLGFIAKYRFATTFRFSDGGRVILDDAISENKDSKLTHCHVSIGFLPSEGRGL